MAGISHRTLGQWPQYASHTIAGHDRTARRRCPLDDCGRVNGARRRFGRHALRRKRRGVGAARRSPLEVSLCHAPPAWQHRLCDGRVRVEMKKPKGAGELAACRLQSNFSRLNDVPPPNGRQTPAPSRASRQTSPRKTLGNERRGGKRNCRQGAQSDRCRSHCKQTSSRPNRQVHRTRARQDGPATSDNTTGNGDVAQCVKRTFLADARSANRSMCD